MNLFAKFNHIPFKYVLAMNATIMVLAITFVSINSVSRTTENRSQAAETPLPSPRLYITVDPAHPPKLLNSDPDWAKVGDALLIHGQNLGQTPFGILSLGDTLIPPQNIVEWTPDYFVITIPPSATTNPVTLRFNDDQILTTTNFVRIVDINESDL